MNNYLEKCKLSLQEQSSKLHALSPAAILDRGYSITQTIPGKSLVKDPDIVALGDSLEVLVAKGSIKCKVEGKSKKTAS